MHFPPVLASPCTRLMLHAHLGRVLMAFTVNSRCPSRIDASSFLVTDSFCRRRRRSRARLGSGDTPSAMPSYSVWAAPLGDDNA